MTKKINIFYFSGTGNTWWVSEQVTAQLLAQGMEAHAYSIEQVTAKEVEILIAEADVVGFGFPTYESDAPRNFHVFIDTLPSIKNEKETLGFVTQMTWSGDGFNFLEKPLREKGYRLRWTACPS